MVKGKKKAFPELWKDFFVGSLGLEPRLFWTKTRRVASYTMSQTDCFFAKAMQR